MRSVDEEYGVEVSYRKHVALASPVKETLATVSPHRHCKHARIYTTPQSFPFRFVRGNLSISYVSFIVVKARTHNSQIQTKPNANKLAAEVH